MRSAASWYRLELQGYRMPPVGHKPWVPDAGTTAMAAKSSVPLGWSPPGLLLRHSASMAARSHGGS